VRHGSYRGGWTITDVSIAAPGLRAYNDALGGDRNKTRGVGGFGPNFVLAYSHVSGAVDDLVEHEGSGQNGLILGNFFDAVPARPYTRSPRAHLGLSTPFWGPTYIVRNLLRRSAPEDFRGRGRDGRAFKIQRTMKEGDDTGRIVLLHNTVFGAPMLAAMTGSGGPLGHVTGAANLFATPAADGDAAEGPGMIWREDAALSPDDATALDAASGAPTDEGPWRRAPALANINDAGPWAWAGAALFGATPPR